MSTNDRIDRRTLLRGLIGLSALGVLEACAPTPVAQAPAAAPPTAPPQPTAAAAAAPVSAVTVAPAPATPTAAAPAVKYAEKAAALRYMTGGFPDPGPDDGLIKKIQEDALRTEYGLNVDVQFESASWADIDALMELRLQTQATDSVQRYDSRVLKWIATPGLIRDIDAEVKQYGKNLLQLLPASGWEFWMRDDHKYIGIPALRSTPADIEYIHIRRDWLDKVGRDVPTNVEELEDALRLFKDKKLGGDVTIPFANENPLWMLASCLIGPWVPDPDKQLQMMQQGGTPLLMQAAFDEERLTLLQRWYKDGLLNPEWTSWKYDQVYGAASKGIIGCISAGWWTLNTVIKDQVLKADPKQDWVQIFPPVGRKGVPNTGRLLAGAPMERGIVVASWAQAPEAIVALADWDNKSFENYMTSRSGIQGKHWKLGEGGTFVNLMTPGPKPEYSGVRGTTWTSKWQIQRALMPAAAGQEPLDPKITPRIYRNAHTRADPAKPEKGEYPMIGLVDHYLPYQFNKTATLEGDLSTIANEQFTKIVNAGAPPAATIKDFWSQWRAAGGDARIQEISDQYTKWIGQHPEWKDPKATLAPDAWDTAASYPERKKA